MPIINGVEMAVGQQYLPDVGFEEGYNFPGDGGTQAWGVPPVDWYDELEWGDTRENWVLGRGYTKLEVQPMFEEWQETPGGALRIETSEVGGVYLDRFVPVLPTRRYLLTYNKKILDASGLNPRLYVRILWSGYGVTPPISFAESVVGRSDIAAGTYNYAQTLTPPGLANGWPQDAYWARIMIYAHGGGGIDAYVDGFIDDVQFAVLIEPPEPTEPGEPQDPGSIESEVGLWMYDALQPLQVHEQRLGYPLLAYADAIGGMFQPTYDIVSDPNILLDPDRTPVHWLPWLAQFVGQPLPGERLPSESELAYRARITPYIKDPPHRRRGTVPAILEEVASFLNAGAQVYAVERQGGSPYVGSIGIIAAQMKPGVTVAQIQARVEEIAPAGRIITVTAITGGDWLSLRTTHTDWADVLSTFDDWAEVRSNPTL